MSLTQFDDSQRSEAEKSRLETELSLRRLGLDHEVELVDAASEAALRRTRGGTLKVSGQVAVLARGNS